MARSKQAAVAGSLKILFGQQCRLSGQHLAKNFYLAVKKVIEFGIEIFLTKLKTKRFTKYTKYKKGYLM